MAGAQIGAECKLYYNTGNFASPTWTEITRAIDVDFSVSSSRGNVNSRISIWNMEAKALNSLEVTFGYRYRAGVTDTVFDALRGYVFGRTKAELAVADGVINTNGTNYLRATYQFEGSQTQPLEDGVQWDFTAFLCSEEDSGTLREPTWTEVT